MVDMSYLKNFDLHKIGNTYVFGVAESNSDLGYPKFKMANPIWWTEIMVFGP